jgi:hypothetical protein
MSRRRLLKSAIILAALATLPPASFFAQELPKSQNDSFEVEPPLLIQPTEMQPVPDDAGEAASTAPLDPAKLARRLEAAKKSAASAARLVKSGVLSKAEAEERALRVVRLEADLAKAKMTADQQQLTLLKTRLAASQATQLEVENATATLAQSTAAAQAAEATYHKARLANAELNLSRQRKLLALGSAHKSDVARAEEKLARLQQAGEEPR